MTETVDHLIIQHGEHPSGRSSHSLTALGNALYLFGGERDVRVPIDSELWRFSLHDHHWTRVDVAHGEKPSPRLAHAAAAVGNRLFIYGGRSSANMQQDTFDELFSFDTVENRWTQYKRSSDDAAWPEKRSYHAMVSHQNKLYLFGGCGEVGRLNTLWEYDSATNQWTLMEAPDAEKLPARGGCGLGFSNNALWVFGGFRGHELGDIANFDLETKTWHYFTDVSIPARSVFAFDSAEGLLVAHGGEGKPSDLGHEHPGDFCDDVALIEIDKNDHQRITTKRLEMKDPKINRRGWHAGALVQRTFYVYGGNQGDNKFDNSLIAIELN